jgi:membrane fusion protein (multidrug efflux system)
LKKQMIAMLILVGLLFGLIFGWKYYQKQQTLQALKMEPPPVTVSTSKVESSLWQPKLKAVGSLRARVGVNVTTELAGMVETIFFTPGARVTKGQVLVQLNAAAEIGKLHSLQAQVELAKITFARDKAQFAARAVAKQVVDTDEWNLKNLQAQVEEQLATVAKKTIRAPFAGRLGINNINPGQYLNVGDTVTNLQSLDPIYADFYIPQQDLALIKLGQVVNITADTFPNATFSGKISTIQPALDASTRNVLVEATESNPKFTLSPGMFVRVEVDIQTPRKYITVPQTAISFNPYGDIAFIVKDKDKTDKANTDKNNPPVYTVEQVFVTVGDTRGNQIAILKGLNAGDVVVTSGQLKLKNGSRIVVNNSVQPDNSPEPKLIKR